VPIHILTSKIEFPDPTSATEDGLLAVGGDLTPERLIEAYSKGVFPWYSDGQPILWFSPDPRMVLYPGNFKCSTSLQRDIQSNRFEVRIDTAFTEVIRSCASAPRPGQEGTWITSDMIDAYIEMHHLGYAHSFETFHKEKLVGGLYGLSLGAAFFGESMFHIESNASKIAFYQLVTFAKKHGFDFIDAQTPSSHLQSLGATSVPRNRFLKELQSTLKFETLKGNWSTI
jgi:leucyl/phenylalanyl-tRNA--protein transferase